MTRGVGVEMAVDEVGVRLARAAVCIVILTWNGADDTLACLATLWPQLGAADQVIVVDNGSADDSERRLRAAFPDLRLIQTGQNLGFAGGNNVGLRAALDGGAPWILLLNNDTLLEPGVIDALVAGAEELHRRSPRVGVVQPLLVRADDPSVIDSAGQFVTRAPGARDLCIGDPVASLVADDPLPIFGACAAAALLRREALLEVGLFDESLFVLLEDTDLAFRLRAAGYEAALLPAIRVRHQRGVSTARRDDVAARRRKLWVQRNLVTLALRWWPTTAWCWAWPLLALRASHALVLARRLRAEPCAALWRRALAERRSCRRRLRRAGGDDWFGRDPLRGRRAEQVG